MSLFRINPDTAQRAHPAADLSIGCRFHGGDYNVSQKQHMFDRYSLWKSLTLEIDPFGTHAYSGELVQGSPENFKTQQGIFSDTYLFNPLAIQKC